MPLDNKIDFKKKKTVYESIGHGFSMPQAQKAQLNQGFF